MRHLARWGAGTAAGALLILGTAAPASAQDAVPRVTGATPEGEIVVTARRRAESLQDVPIAVTAFDANRVSELQADDISGLRYSVPNLYLDQGDGGNAVIYIRGVGQNDSLAFADAGVGVYVDDVFVARSQAAFLELFDVERIEVLRGPQGTLYGRNTIGGAVKFVSTRPARELEGYLEAGIGNFDFLTLRGRVSGPLAGDALRGKVAFAVTRRDGYNDNLFTGADDGDLESYAGRVALLFEPSPQFELLLSADARRDRPDTSRSPHRETPITVAAPAVVTLPALDDPYDVETNANGLNDLDAYGVSLTARWRPSDRVTIESITAYRAMNFDLVLDTDGSPLPVLDILLRQDQRQFSQELRLLYQGSRLTFTGGLYYFYDRDISFSGYDDGAATIFGLPVVALGFPNAQLAETRQITNSYAVFGDATYALTDRLSLSAGLRYTYERRSSGRTFESYFDPAISVTGNEPPFLQGVGVPGQPIGGRASFEAFTPRVSVSYDATDDVLLYASAARGFKSGGFDGRAASDFQFRPFRPEYVWSYEGGLKTRWLGGRLIANAAIFYNDYTDVQVTSFGADPVTGVFQSLFTNAASARAYGAELELVARPTRGLTINASLGYLDARYREFEVLVGTVVTDVSDRHLVNAPRWNGSIGATYRAPLSARLSGTIHVDAAYRSTSAIEITDSPVLRQPGYGLINGFVAIGSSDERWELRAGVRNLTDKAVRVQGFNLESFPGVQVGFYAAPRTYDLRLILRY
ncbi:TonB-dependent receptor [Sphingosinicella sp. LHD-64]|uniref:TonB-dependent receptor n=1 Tax=Sphingosinicella sp. LHD-64 TaxID=3072139 RepID=UPI00280E2739|nr:TonB-dependent receptor [Sphingosinicella sp. LHD-64]MDQ8755433.1 TonB-dependent receptor [Sphingosinicella sp. LHD-64]